MRNVLICDDLMDIDIIFSQNIYTIKKLNIINSYQMNNENM